MMASELITKLQARVDKHGDRFVLMNIELVYEGRELTASIRDVECFEDCVWAEDRALVLRSAGPVVASKTD